MGVPAVVWSWLGMEPGARNISVPLHLPQVGCLPPSFLLPQTCLLQVFKDNERTYKA